MQGIKHIGDAENPQKRHCGQPFIRQDNGNQRGGAGGQPHHHGHDDISARTDGSAGHVSHPVLFILLLRKHWQQHAVDRGIDIGNDQVGKLLSLIIIGQIRICIPEPDDQLPALGVGGIQQGRDQQLPAIGNEPLEPVPGKGPYGPPLYGEPQHHAVYQQVYQPLPYQRPKFITAAGHGDTRYGSGGRAAQSGKKEAFKLQGLGHIRLLHIGEAGKDHRKTQYPYDRCQGFVFISPGDDGSQEKQSSIQKQAEHHVEIEYGGIVQLIRFFFLDKGVGHAAVYKNLQQGGDHRDQRKLPISVRGKEPGQNDGYDKSHALSAASFCETPEEVGGYFLFIIVHVFSSFYHINSSIPEKTDPSGI